MGAWAANHYETPVRVPPPCNPQPAPEHWEGTFVDRSPRRPSGVRLLVAATAAIAVIAPWTLHAGASEPSQRGWWNRASQDVSTPLGQLPPAPAPDVPDEGLPVGATLGEPTRATGIGMMVDAPPGASVDVATLTLVEDSSVGDDAEVVACPILEFWVDGPNQPYDSMPPVDCEGAVVGERADDGTWTFDLGIIAADWLDLDSGLDPNGVALLPAPESTGTFQVVFDGASAQVDLQTSGGSDADDPFGTPGADAGGFDLDLGSDVGFDSGFGGGSFDGGGFSSPDLGTGDVSFDPVGEAGPDGAPDEAAAGDAGSGDGDESAAPVASRSPMGLGELPGAAWLLLPAALVLAGVTSYALGPAGDPTAAASGRTIARALATRSRLEAS
jgi:hypothetical protein